MLHNNEKEWATDKHNKDESHVHYTERKEPDTRVHTMIPSGPLQKKFVKPWHIEFGNWLKKKTNIICSPVKQINGWLRLSVGSNNKGG